MARLLPLVATHPEPPINAPLHTPNAAEAHAVVRDGRPLRVALLGYRSAPFSGGQGVYLRYLSQALMQLGHDVTVISGPPYPHLVEGVKLVQLPSLDLYSRDLWSVTREELGDSLGRKEWFSKLSGGFAEPETFGERVRDWLLDHADEFDVVHDNQTLAEGILDLQRAGLPVVTTIHHPITRDLRVALAGEPRWWWRLMIRRWHRFLGMQSRVAAQLRHIVTVSRCSAADIATDFGVLPGSLHVVPNGVDTELFKPMPTVTRNPSQIIATASADAPLKGLPVLLKALKKLVEADPARQLVLIARPKPGGDTEAVIKHLGLVDHIRFVGDASHEEINHLYAESAVAVVPRSTRVLVYPPLRRWPPVFRWYRVMVALWQRWSPTVVCRYRRVTAMRWQRLLSVCSLIRRWQVRWAIRGGSVWSDISAGQSVRSRWPRSIEPVLKHVDS